MASGKSFDFHSRVGETERTTLLRRYPKTTVHARCVTRPRIELTDQLNASIVLEWSVEK